MADTFTLVIPAYNEGLIIRETLTAVVTACRKHCPEPWHVIVVDNASIDGTADLVEGFGDPHVRAIRLKEKGRGRAIRTGFEAAGGGIVAFTDADLPIEPAEVLKGLDMIRRGQCEALIGTRFARGGGTVNKTLLRKGTSKIFQILASIIVGLRASDSQCPLKITSERMTPIMLATTDPTWWSELEFVLLLEKLNIAVCELPVVWTERHARRKSTVKVLRDGVRAVQAMLRMRSSIPQQAEKLTGIIRSR